MPPCMCEAFLSVSSCLDASTLTLGCIQPLLPATMLPALSNIRLAWQALLARKTNTLGLCPALVLHLCDPKPCGFSAAHLLRVRQAGEAGLVLRGRQVHAVLQHAAVPPRKLLAVGARRRVLEAVDRAALREEEAEHGCGEQEIEGSGHRSAGKTKRLAWLAGAPHTAERVSRLRLAER